jgi:signal transduction histidine kinase
MLRGMRREVQRLTRLVSDLLTLSRLDAHQALRVQSIDLTVLAHEVAEEIKPLAQPRAITIAAEGDTRVRGDPDRLKQVLLNLTDNAVRATDPASGAIQIHLREQNDMLQIAVSDNGVGIAPEALPHLYERFYRADKARTRAGGGSGLGLTIVKAIVEAHGGKLAPVQSAPGQGSTFAVSLPR